MPYETVNLLGIYGAGNDTAFGGGLRWLMSEVRKVFTPAQVFIPRIIDWTEYNTCVRLLHQWKDPTILVMHSCGNNCGTRAAVELSMELIPYMMCVAPSMYCQPAPLPPNVLRATQAYSKWDFFNPFQSQLVKPSSVNNKTKIDGVKTGRTHVQATYSPEVLARLISEIRITLAAGKAPS